MVFKFLACLVQELIWSFCLLLWKHLPVLILKIVPVFLCSHWSIFPVYIHCRLSEQFSGSQVAFKTTFVVIGGYQKAGTEMLMGLSEQSLELVNVFKKANSNFIINFLFHKAIQKHKNNMVHGQRIPIKINVTVSWNFCIHFFSWIIFPQAPGNNIRVISNIFCRVQKSK